MDVYDRLWNDLKDDWTGREFLSLESKCRYIVTKDLKTSLICNVLNGDHIFATNVSYPKDLIKEEYREKILRRLK